MLKKTSLRESVLQIDAAKDREAALNKARESPMFAEFVTTVLHEIGAYKMENGDIELLQPPSSGGGT